MALQGLRILELCTGHSTNTITTPKNKSSQSRHFHLGFNFSYSAKASHSQAAKLPRETFPLQFCGGCKPTHTHVLPHRAPSTVQRSYQPDRVGSWYFSVTSLHTYKDRVRPAAAENSTTNTTASCCNGRDFPDGSGLPFLVQKQHVTGLNFPPIP